jgi:hypothetical protein
MHWRWATVAGVQANWLSPIDKNLLPAAGQLPFKGSGGAGTPLLDSHITDQTIRLAVTKNFNLNLSNEVLSTQKFEELFLNRKAIPDEVKNGEDLVIWMSIEVFRSSENP